jgi:hypothetical protein
VIPKRVINLGGVLAIIGISLLLYGADLLRRITLQVFVAALYLAFLGGCLFFVPYPQGEWIVASVTLVAVLFLVMKEIVIPP